PHRAVAAVGVVELGAPTTWIQEMLQYKRDGVLPTDDVAARRLRRTQAWYCEIGNRLYRRSFLRPLLCCLDPDEARSVLAEVHDGIC
ncbi:unnamed protein product, partial [Musa textilis]